MHKVRDFLRRRFGERGQSLVEFAITLPMLMLFLLIAIDFGRVFIGYVNVQNMTRIAANFASVNPTAWEDGVASVQTRYRNQLLADASATGCSLPSSGGSVTVPTPQFPDGTSVGGSAQVQVTCSFKLISPFWSWFNLFPGLSIPVSATAQFPIRTGMSGTVTAPGAVNPPIANFDAIPQTHEIYESQQVAFIDESGGTVDAWSWCFNWDVASNTCALGASSSDRDPVYIYPSPGSYTVRLVVSNMAGTDTIVKQMFILVRPTALDVDFTFTPSSGAYPLSVTFTGSSTQTITSWTWDFGDASSGSANTATTKVATHTYATPGIYTIKLTVVPAGSPPFTVVKSNAVTVTDKTCTVPNLIGYKKSDAILRWTSAHFTGSITDAKNAPSGNYTVKYQSITALSPVPCSSNIQISKVAP